MSDLSPDAAALIRAGRCAFRPGLSDRERVFRSLCEVLGYSAVHRRRRERIEEAATASRIVVQRWLVRRLSAVALGSRVGHPSTRRRRVLG
jgi:hypothetical protein